MSNKGGPYVIWSNDVLSLNEDGTAIIIENKGRTAEIDPATVGRFVIFGGEDIVAEDMINQSVAEILNMIETRRGRTPQQEQHEEHSQQDPLTQTLHNVLTGLTTPIRVTDVAAPDPQPAPDARSAAVKAL